MVTVPTAEKVTGKKAEKVTERTSQETEEAEEDSDTSESESTASESTKKAESATEGGEDVPLPDPTPASTAEPRESNPVPETDKVTLLLRIVQNQQEQIDSLERRILYTGQIVPELVSRSDEMNDNISSVVHTCDMLERKLARLSTEFHGLVIEDQEKKLFQLSLPDNMTPGRPTISARELFEMSDDEIEAYLRMYGMLREEEEK